MTTNSVTEAKSIPTHVGELIEFLQQVDPSLPIYCNDELGVIARVERSTVNPSRVELTLSTALP